MAIQLIINQELGLARNENPLQGSFVIEELTDLVEDAVMLEFRRDLASAAACSGAMERMYQRSRIQDESLLYEKRKHDGTLPIIGVNTFLDPAGSPTTMPDEVIRSTAGGEGVRDRDARGLRGPECRARSPLALAALRHAALSSAGMSSRS